jgi:hypothetical protein
MPISASVAWLVLIFLVGIWGGNPVLAYPIKSSPEPRGSKISVVVDVSNRADYTHYPVVQKIDWIVLNGSSNCKSMTPTSLQFHGIERFQGGVNTGRIPISRFCRPIHIAAPPQNGSWSVANIDDRYPRHLIMIVINTWALNHSDFYARAMNNIKFFTAQLDRVIGYLPHSSGCPPKGQGRDKQKSGEKRNGVFPNLGQVYLASSPYQANGTIPASVILFALGVLSGYGALITNAPYPDILRLFAMLLTGVFFGLALYAI